MKYYKLLDITRECMIETLKQVGEDLEVMITDRSRLDDAYEDAMERITSTIDVLKEDLEEL